MWRFVIWKRLHSKFIRERMDFLIIDIGAVVSKYKKIFLKNNKIIHKGNDKKILLH